MHAKRACKTVMKQNHNSYGCISVLQTPWGYLLFSAYTALGKLLAHEWGSFDLCLLIWFPIIYRRNLLSLFAAMQPFVHMCLKLFSFQKYYGSSKFSHLPITIVRLPTRSSHHPIQLFHGSLLWLQISHNLLWK